ncbi:hypothetical protein Tco_0439370 [Tanacetum coccineum]
MERGREVVLEREWLDEHFRERNVVDKVRAFYTKNLARPWQTMFKGFNRCLTTRTSGHNQTKINIIQIFHVVINRTDVDYVALLWWDFMNNVHQKKEAIHLHAYTTGNVLVRGMLIPDAFLTEEIHATDDFKEYETVFMNVDVPMNQPQLVISTQRIYRSTPKAHRTPTLTASPQGKKKKQSRERDAIAEATLLSLALHKTTLDAEAQENIAKVQEKLDGEEIEKIVEDEESYASAFADSVFNDDVDDSEDVEIEKEKDIADNGTGSMEIRKEQKQTPISSPTRSPRNVSSSDKTVYEELTAIISPTTTITSKDSSTTKRKKRSFSHKTKTLPGSIAEMYKRRGQIHSHIKNKFITHEFFMGKIQEVLDHCNKVIPEMTFAKTNEMIKEEMPQLVKLVVDKDREVSPVNILDIVSKEFVAHGPKMIEELLFENSSTKWHCSKVKSYTYGSRSYKVDILKSTGVVLGARTVVAYASGPTIEDTSITQADLHPSVNPVAGEPSSAQSTSRDVSLAEPNQVTQPPDHLRRWTKDHPLDNIVGISEDGPKIILWITSLAIPLVLYLPENS